MSPIQQEPPLTADVKKSPVSTIEPTLNDDSIVISGISGMYPKANNIKEFADILYNKENTVSETGSRWDLKHPELSHYVGEAPNIDRFDAQFFMVHHRIGHYMDPMSRKLLEHSFQAMYDAGLSPAHLNGKKVGVFIGSSFSDTENDCISYSKSKIGAGLMGSNKSMQANRISYWLNVKGPSLAVDNCDSSSITALQLACAALRRGDCEAAIVGGSHLCLYPHGNIHHGRLAMVSRDGKTKSFAENADGYVLADAINVIFLQKAKYALRSYAEVVHAKTEHIPIASDAIGPKYGYNRNSEITAKFIKDFCSEVQVPPQAVEYVEAYGTGVPHADKCELEAIAKVYCEDRQNTLLVGSITSNIGLTAAASGISSITKIILGYHKGILAANLNCEQLRQDVSAFDKMRVITEHQPFGRAYTAINGTSVTGVNSHVLLHGHYKPKDLSRYCASIPYLVTLSGRQEPNVKSIFENLKSHRVDAEEIALLHNIHSKNISGHLGRGYIILDNMDAEKNETNCLIEKADYFNNAKRPLWFVYSGMGSQWAGMGTQLMRLPIFALAIERCKKALAPMGVDIVEIICSPDKTIFDNIMNSFVGITAIQIGLTDILRELGLTPDGIIGYGQCITAHTSHCWTRASSIIGGTLTLHAGHIGHSMGELGCAYADGSLTAEETILASYTRGKVSLETPLIRGSMAAVGLGCKQISAMCPTEIEVACHNSSQSSTISGPADLMQTFVAELTAKGIFAKEVPCSNIAYHSRYIADAGPNLLKYLKKVIKSPKPRSERWLSTSVPQDKWDDPSAKYCSAEYHTNNLLNPVLFEESCRLIPSNAVLVEVAPHGILQAILKRSMPRDCRNIPLTRRGHPDKAVHLLQAIGNVYMEGYAMRLQALYPPVQFPVSTETPMLSHLVEWMHTDTWGFTAFEICNRKTAAICKFVKSIHDNEFKCLQGHIIRNKMCYPFAAALVTVWDMVSMHMNLPKGRAPIIFQDVHLHAQPLLFNQKPLKLNVSLQSGGRFEVTSKYSKVVSGFIIEPHSDLNTYENGMPKENKELKLTSKYIYQLLNERSYKYSGEFQSIEWVSASLDTAGLVWADNWITFIDGILQLNLLRQPSHVTSLPTCIKRLRIDVNDHINSAIHHLDGKNLIKADITDEWTRCGGVLLEHIRYHHIFRVTRGLSNHDSTVALYEAEKLKEITSQHNETEMVSLQIEQIGKLESLHWVPSSYTDSPGVTVTVHFAGLDIFDVKRATGIAASECNAYGMDYSGLTKNGERVMGLVRSGAASSQVRALPALLWPVPAHWSLEEAATVPLAYAYAFYVLVIKGNIGAGMNILIQEGTDALGQAVIAIAFAFKCQVFTTVSDNVQKNILLKRFPQLQEEYIGDTCDISFADKVLQATLGKGCHIVIACTKGTLKDASIRCCRFGGVLIDTVQIQDRESYNYRMCHMIRANSYLTIDFQSIFTYNNDEDMQMLHELLSAGIVSGCVVPLTCVTYAPRHVQRAFELLHKGRHFGRVLLSMSDTSLQTQHRILCDSHNCRILFRNNKVGGLGIKIAEEFMRQGALKLHIYSKKSAAHQLFKFRSFKKLDGKLEVSSEELVNLLPIKVLKDGINLGIIEGMYIITATTKNNNKSFNKFMSALDELDLLSRTLCHQVKYFIVVSTIKDLGEKVCLSRVKSGLIATRLDPSNIKNMKILADFEVTNAIESSQCNNKVTLVPRIKDSNQKPQLFNEVLGLAGVNVAQHEHVGMNVTLQELGMENKKVSSICAYLDIMYNLSLEERQVPYLTLQKIQELEKYVSEIVPTNVKGLLTFISNIYHDELLATMDLVVLSTLSHKIISMEYDYNIPGQYLCIIPGIEGHHERFRQLCKRLKLPAIVLQPGLDHPYETAKETAQRYAEVLSRKSKLQDKFYILGYENGVLVALELAAILEEQGFTGTVFCLGYVPSEFHMEVEHQLSEFVTEKQLQDALIHHISELMCNGDATELHAQLQTANSWTEKVAACAWHLVQRAAHSAQYTRALLEATLARLVQARRAAPATRTLQSKLVVLRAASPRASGPSPQRLSHQPVLLHQLQSPLSCVATDMQCASLINQYLDDNIQQEFLNKNLCECYSVCKRN